MNNPLVEQMLRTLRMRRKIVRYTPAAPAEGRVCASFRDDLGRSVVLDLSEHEFNRCHKEVLALQNLFAKLVIDEQPSAAEPDAPPEET